MNSMFDRLGEYLKDYINDDEQGIFSSPEEQIEKEKSTQNFSQDNQSTEKEKNAYTTENIKTEKSKEKFTFTQKETETKTEFKFDTSKQQSEYNKTENKQKHTYKKTEHSKSKPKNTNQTTGKRYYVPFELYEDFKTLCLMPGTNLDECKVAYKSLLKKFHPDKFANEPEKQKEATEITSSITSAFTRIKTWYEENLPKF